jgi:hypothetical protein
MAITSRTNRTVALATGKAVWCHSDLPQVPIDGLPVSDPPAELLPQACSAPIST